MQKTKVPAASLLLLPAPGSVDFSYNTGTEKWELAMTGLRWSLDLNIWFYGSLGMASKFVLRVSFSPEFLRTELELEFDLKRQKKRKQKRKYRGKKKDKKIPSFAVILSWYIFSGAHCAKYKNCECKNTHMFETNFVLPVVHMIYLLY